MPKKYSEKEERMTRSAKLRKYGSVYKSYLRNSEQSKISKSPRRPRNKTSKTLHKPSRARKEKFDRDKTRENISSSKRKPLNAYQKFVKQESKKEKYMKIPGKERLSSIAREWNKINRK